ncbi:family 31 glycoside hydrolase [Phytophthora cinnamomi]|uniref:family 31 glycoside hydrolase n=1 Tax=Phytophthora cinnamomi TaxID=4785 RepID=UPI00355AC76D|nr:family 31 glycoside hydrolase [Phytophthora cinnamomi]
MRQFRPVRFLLLALAAACHYGSDVQAATNETAYLTTSGYFVANVTDSGAALKLQLTRNSTITNATYGDDIDDLMVEVTKSSNDAVRIKIADDAGKRWQVPPSLYSKSALGSNASTDGVWWSASGSATTFTYTSSPFTFQVTRKTDGYVLFDSSAMSLVVKDKYLQIATTVSRDVSVFGFGESTQTNLRVQAGDKRTLWARDEGSANANVNLYGSHPFFMGVNGDGQAHGVLLLNSNGMDMTLEEDKIVYQTIGGVLDFHIVAGPSPAEVVAQYTALIGRPKLMPYWSYGFHQCRYGYNSSASLREVVRQYKAHEIPLDVMWADIDYMNDYEDFTLDPVNFPEADMTELLAEIHDADQKFVPIVDPGIPDDDNLYAYTRGLEMDIFVKNSDGKPYLGQVWPGPTYFPDFFHPDAQSYWAEQFTQMHALMAFDGIWIDMNELSNFCNGLNCSRSANVTCPNASSQTTCCLVCADDESEWNSPPFAINNDGDRTVINYKTVSASAQQYGGVLQYDAHNLYGFTEAIATNSALETVLNKRAFVLSRSTFAGSGGHTAHWTGDNAATWNDLQWSIPTVLNFGMYGVSMVGADICGFADNTTEELCARWTALGAFYPFARNHNVKGANSQETYVWASVAEIGRKFIGMRYRLLPYLYTLGYEAHATGAPIARALFFEFPADINARASPYVDNQFMLGSSLLVVPVLAEGATNVTGYVPSGVWYDLFDYAKTDSTGTAVTWNVSLYDMPVLVRGGSVLPMHQAALTSTAARKAPYDLLVALSANGTASGELYQDDIEAVNGDEQSTIVQFSVSSGVFSSKVARNNYSGQDFTDAIASVVVLGVSSSPSRVTLSPSGGELEFTYNATSEALVIDASSANFSVVQEFTVSWQ